jgi:hypothetical protein
VLLSVQIRNRAKQELEANVAQLKLEGASTVGKQVAEKEQVNLSFSIIACIRLLADALFANGEMQLEVLAQAAKRAALDDEKRKAKVLNNTSSHLFI